MKELFELFASSLGIQATTSGYYWGYSPNGRLHIEFLKDGAVSVLMAQSMAYMTWRVTDPSNSNTEVVKTSIWPDELDRLGDVASTFPFPSGEVHF